jgi:hypothetical protein
MNVLPTLFPPGVVTSVYCGRSPSGTTNFVPYLDSAETAGVNVLVIAYTLLDAIYLVQQWRSMRIRNNYGYCRSQNPTYLAVPFWDYRW